MDKSCHYINVYIYFLVGAKAAEHYKCIRFIIYSVPEPKSNSKDMCRLAMIILVVEGKFRIVIVGELSWCEVAI